MVIGICDDEQCWRDKEVQMCNELKKHIDIQIEYEVFTFGEEILNCNKQIDILLLDVEMPGINGIEVKEKISNLSNIKNILFVSWNKDAVYDSFGDKTRGYLSKPIDDKKFIQEMNKIIDRLQKESDEDIIEIFPENRSILLNTKDIMYISGDGNYIKIVTVNNAYTETKNLKYWEEIFYDKHIRRVHKSYLINFRYIEEFKSTHIKINNVTEFFPVGRKYYATRREEYKEYRFARYRRG